MLAKWIVGLALGVTGVFAVGCSSDSCGDGQPCSSGFTCIKGGTCAQSCSPDAGNNCPPGMTCQVTSGFCRGTACAAIAVWVCE